MDFVKASLRKLHLKRANLTQIPVENKCNKMKDSNDYPKSKIITNDTFYLFDCLSPI